MVYTELAPRWQQFQVAPAMQQPKSAVSTPLPWMLKICTIYSRIQSLIQNHIRHVRDESAGEQRITLYIKAMNTINNPSPHGSQSSSKIVYSSSDAAPDHTNGTLRAATRRQHPADHYGCSQRCRLCQLSHQPCHLHLRAAGNSASRVSAAFRLQAQVYGLFPLSTAITVYTLGLWKVP